MIGTPEGSQTNVGFGSRARRNVEPARDIVVTNFFSIA
jgi:hypothetical protein